ncbi:NADAR family protein [Methanobrevibacter sp.]|uniref:NADAR family protein n=1 Tax=Methanobrevibacter sp. TaxID=66852 RepID=UPI0025DE4494|nr:NADAR family protein [Methanobrevibacter sp.]MBR4448365.1 NADAR family protein [Methanobrevibacter sp.]
MVKKYCDKGKYAAPRWLVYPELSAITIGWRMGYGEDYRMNEPPRTEEFYKLFPQPQNWLFEDKKFASDREVLSGFLWRDYGRPKYSQIGEDRIVVNDFITMGDEKEFRQNGQWFRSIEHMVLYSRYGSCTGDHNLEIPIRILRDYEVPESERARWEEFKYTVCLNACYYKIMNDEDLKKWLLSTGDKSLVYISDDEWGGQSNLFGFALMELRDEIRRLYKNEHLIDWEYTEYLKDAYPYVNHNDHPEEDPQSPEYQIIRQILQGGSRYVRDVDLDDALAGKYEAGQILTEKAFVDATPKIGGMLTSHRYLIISQYMADLSQFEHGTGWGLHTAARNSRFKVLDVYTFNGKTQIVLAQLPDGFEEVFETTSSLERKIVVKIRKEFKETLKFDPIDEVNTPEWRQRVSFPIGMSDEGEFF